MAESESDWNPPEELTPEWMEEVDELYLSPEERAKAINEKLSDETLYDLVCFCVEWLGKVATPAFFAENQEVQNSIRRLGATIYGLHYFNAPSILGPPDRTDELKAESFKEFIRDMKPEYREALRQAMEQYVEEGEAPDGIHSISDKRDEIS